MRITHFLLSLLATASLISPSLALAQDVPPGDQTATDATLTYSDYMSLGYSAQQAGRYGEAVQYFRNALYLNPNDRAAVVAYWNAIDGTLDGEAGLGSETPVESSYDRYMRLGYDATQREEYDTALEFFQRALQERPNDYYATEAIENVTLYQAN